MGQFRTESEQCSHVQIPQPFHCLQAVPDHPRPAVLPVLRHEHEFVVGADGADAAAVEGLWGGPEAKPPAVKSEKSGTN